MNILVADDDKVMSAMLCGVLKDAGHMCIPAFDSMQVMMNAMRQKLDLVLLDINMPGGTGMDVLKRLKNSTKTNLIPVVVITGSTDTALPEQAKALGAVQFLSKPVDPEMLLQAVLAATR